MLSVLDVAVGLAFVVAAVVGVGPIAERALFASVGAAWLLGSVVDRAQIAHQGVLIVALLAFPTGRVGGTVRWAVVVGATLVALGYVPQLGVVALFVVTAIAALAVRPNSPVGAWYPAVAAVLVSTVLAWVWWATQFTFRSWNPSDGLVVYQTVLLAAAVGFVVATRIDALHRHRLADRLLHDEGLEGLDGLARVLGSTLGDADLRVLRWDDSTGGYVGPIGRPASTDPARRLLAIDDAGCRVAAVEHRSVALGDAATVAGVAAAVRLVVSNARLRDALHAQLDELEAARRRMVAAMDRQRAAIAARLRDEVVAPVESAVDELRLAAVGRTQVGEIVDVVVQELAGAADEVDALVAGVPRNPLGGGRLVAEVRTLAGRSPVPVRVNVSGNPVADPATETTLLYVVSEALTNAAKHAGACSVEVAIAATDCALSATISDDGEGGANASGRGLQGLADRVAAAGGRLRVDSPSAGGTTVVASIPSS
jgi:signal transduction histidine kinase